MRITRIPDSFSRVGDLYSPQRFGMEESRREEDTHQPVFPDADRFFPADPARPAVPPGKTGEPASHSTPPDPSFFQTAEPPAVEDLLLMEEELLGRKLTPLQREIRAASFKVGDILKRVEGVENAYCLTYVDLLQAALNAYSPKGFRMFSRPVMAEEPNTQVISNKRNRELFLHVCTALRMHPEPEMRALIQELAALRERGVRSGDLRIKVPSETYRDCVDLLQQTSRLLYRKPERYRNATAAIAGATIAAEGLLTSPPPFVSLSRHHFGDDRLVLSLSPSHRTISVPMKEKEIVYLPGAGHRDLFQLPAFRRITTAHVLVNPQNEFVSGMMKQAFELREIAHIPLLEGPFDELTFQPDCIRVMILPPLQEHAPSRINSLISHAREFMKKDCTIVGGAPVTVAAGCADQTDFAALKQILDQNRFREVKIQHFSRVPGIRPWNGIDPLPFELTADELLAQSGKWDSAETQDMVFFTARRSSSR